MTLGIVEANGWQLDPAPWTRHAACIGADPTVFFPGRGGHADQARTYCNRCPVRADCLDYALRWNIQHGIWGGASERERRHMRRTSRPVRLAGTGHGTRGAYSRGCRCEPCTAANRDYQRRWRTLFDSDHMRVHDIRPSGRYL
jgi:WhiB family redox-sensing transcriptional regulator